MQEHKMRLSTNGETIVKHREMIDENKHVMSANQDLINKIGSKLERARDSLSNEITMTRDELQQKMEQNDKFYLEQMTTIDGQIRTDKKFVETKIEETQVLFNGTLNKEVERLKTFVNNITSAAQAHRETLQENYNEKLSKIKDVCA